MSKQSYPELEAIPPAPPRSSVSAAGSSSVPTWFVRLFATFPLVTYPAAKLLSPAPTALPTRPTLYVAPHLNRDGTLSLCSIGPAEALNEKEPERKGWSSSDPIALRWQMELLFRKVAFDVEFIDPAHNWGPAKSMPFLHLPPSFQAGNSSGRASYASRSGPALLPAPALSHFLDNYFPSSKPELGEKDESPWSDKTAQLEAQTWINLLQGRVMAAVLLATLLSPQSASYLEQHQQPLLSALLSSQLQNTFYDQQLRRISALNPAASSSTSTGAVSSQPTSRLPGWEVGFLGWIGARTSMAASAVSASDVDARGGGDTPGAALANPAVDQVRITSDATQALQALADRTKASLSSDQHLLGATRPTSLDALAFAVIHTILTLAATPQARADQRNEPLSQLKAILDQSPWLIDWSRRIWKSHVRDLELA